MSQLSPGMKQSARIVLAALAVAVLAVDYPASAQTKRQRFGRQRPARRPIRPMAKQPVKVQVIKGAVKKPKTATNNVKTNTGGGKSPLADVFAGNDGGAYFVSEFNQNGKKRVVWMGEHPGRKYAHVFRGVRTGSTISGNYVSISKYKATSAGQLKVRVNANGSMTRLSSTGGFPTKSWTVRSIHGIVKLLPGKRNPAYTTFSLSDLDGAFDDKNGYRYYVRETNGGLFGVAEAPFKKGNQPAAVMAFFLKRTGAMSLSGDVYALPKGKKKGRSTMKFSVKNNRSLLKTAGIPFGGGPLLPVLTERPDIKIPIKDVMDILNSQMNKVDMLLDNWNGKLEQRSYVKFGNGKPSKFPLPYVEVKITKVGRKRQTFINDVKLDIANVKSLGGNTSRLSLIFETGGKELKRRMIGAIGNDDKRLADWDIKNIRVDVDFALVNYGKSISYEVKKVNLHAVVDVRALPEKLDKWISSKVQPIIEKEIKKELNKSVHRSKVSNMVASKVQSLQSYLSKYNLYGYSAANLAPKTISIKGNDLVIGF